MLQHVHSLKEQKTSLVALVTLILLGPTVSDARTLRSSISTQNACPVVYERHSLEDVTSGAVAPYLYGGIYNRANCKNCETPGLWPDFCGLRPTRVDYFDHKICSGLSVKNLVTSLLQQVDTGPLTLTPCDLWNFMRGRTTWIIG